MQCIGKDVRVNSYNLLFMSKLAVKHWKVLIITAVATAAMAFSYFNFVAKPMYSATGSIVVTNGTIISDSSYGSDKDKLENSDIVASLNFVDTVVDMLKTPKVYKRLSAEIDGKYDFSTLKNMATVERRSDTTLFVDVSFTASSPKEAVEIVNSYFKVAPQCISESFPNATATVMPADSARSMYPGNFIIVLFGGVLGAVIAFIIVLLIYSSNPVVRDEEGFREHIGIEVIGTVPDFTVSKNAEKRMRKRRA